jgi:choline monooxygenase
MNDPRPTMQAGLEGLLSAAELRSMRAPIDQALTFPATAYTSREFYKAEIERIYRRRWIAVCLSFDVPDPGDAVPVWLCGMPIVIVRGQDRVVRAFHNICPYDGCPLVLEPQRGLNHLVSPYHGWRYSLEGELRETPYWTGRSATEHASAATHATALRPVRVAEFMLTVFVCLDPQEPDLGEHVAPILRQFSEYDLEGLAPGRDASGRAIVSVRRRRTNWKTFCENAALNVLHESFVHALYAASPEVPRVDHLGTPTFESLVDRRLLALAFDERKFRETYPETDLKHVGKMAAPTRACFATLYPNFYFSLSPATVEISVVLPEGPDGLVERQALLYQVDEAQSPASLASRQLMTTLFEDAAAEDARITEAVHSARASPAYSQKFYSPFWDRLHYSLNQLILDDLCQ